MKQLVISLLLWGVISLQSNAMMVSPIAGGKTGVQEQYSIEITAVSYFYRLDLYDENHILLDSTFQFTQGTDLEAFIVESDSDDFAILVVMRLEDDSEAYDLFNFNGSFLEKEST